jgi:hypothetical protein
VSADFSRLKSEIRQVPKSELKRFWADLGYILTPAAPEWHDRPATELQRDRLLRDVTAALAEDLHGAGIGLSAPVADIVREFYDLIVKSPVNAKKGGNGFNGCLQVYAVARLLNPKVIIESGVFRGQTTWILRQACPQASIFCFDVDFSNLVHKDRDAIYSQADWSDFDLSGLPGDETLAFFDDHIDQGRRVLEAQERGLTRLLFDDNAPAERIHAVGGPPTPTLDMLMDPSLDGHELTWTYRGKRYACHIDAAKAQEVRKAVVALRNFADMHRITGYTPARITYVSLERGNPARVR